jgi:cobalamin biosynthetic protein CobC
MPAPDVFWRLPGAPAALQRAAASSYLGADAGTETASVVVAAGTQALIQVLPHCLINQPLLVPAVGYQEYRRQWENSGRDVLTYPSLQRGAAAAAIDAQLQADAHVHLLLINPNNPTGIEFTPAQIRHWSEQLAPGSCLLVDEAFMDLQPGQSLLGAELPDNVIVLRSFGKFFGLAGLRLGFAFCSSHWRQLLLAQLGPWGVNGPAQAIALQALCNRAWQQEARATIRANADLTAQLLQPLMAQLQAPLLADCGLFLSYVLPLPAGRWIYTQLARHGVLLRPVALDREQVLLRFGIVDGTQLAQSRQLAHAVSSTCARLQQLHAGAGTAV